MPKPEPEGWASPIPRLTLYSRAGCHLCELALEALERLQYRVEVVDIAGQSDLEARYGPDIPVLAHGERVLLKGVINKNRLSNLKLQLLREAGAGVKTSNGQTV